MYMRLGCFGYIKDLDTIAAAGFDCAELHIKELMGLDGTEFHRARKHLKDCGIPAEVFDNPIPLDSKISDPSFDLEFYNDYLEKAFYRAAEMGAQYIVFGNGQSRSLPKEGNLTAAQAKFNEFFIKMLDIAAVYNLTILIEPLSPKLSNIVNNLPEAVQFIKRYGRFNLKTFVDYRYMVELNRPLIELQEYELYIRHIHLDNPTTIFPNRVVPRLGDGFDYSPFLEALKKISYKGIISIEASVFKDFSEDISSVIGFFSAHGIKPYRAALSV